MNKNAKLDELLCYIEENIDLEHLRKVESLHLDILGYKKVNRLPLTIIFPVDTTFTPYKYKESFEDPEKMLFNELLFSFSSIYNSVTLKDYFPLHIRSNHGIGIMPSVFGAESKILEDNMPWVDHLESMESVKSIIKKGIPEFNSSLAGKVIETYKYFIDRLKEYPKCFKGIHISQPDLQGPFDIAHLLIGSNIFYELYDNADVIHELLDVITQTYIKFRRHIARLLTDEAGDDAVYVHGSIYGGKVVIKDDTATVNLSQNMYDEFSKQYNEKILEAFRGGSIHHCGLERPWHFKSMISKWLKGINYGNPEMHNIKKSFEYWEKYNVPIIFYGYNQDISFLNQMNTCQIDTGVSLAVKANNFQEAKDILFRYEEKSLRE